MNKKLGAELEKVEIKQTRNKRIVIPFRDSTIDKVTNHNTEFGTRRFKEFKFDVSKGSSLKGLLLRFSKKTQRKDFVLSFWFNNKPDYYNVGTYPNIRCKDVERLCLELAQTHQDQSEASTEACQRGDFFSRD